MSVMNRRLNRLLGDVRLLENTIAMTKTYRDMYKLKGIDDLIDTLRAEQMRKEREIRRITQKGVVL